MWSLLERLKAAWGFVVDAVRDAPVPYVVRYPVPPGWQFEKLGSYAGLLMAQIITSPRPGAGDGGDPDPSDCFLTEWASAAHFTSCQGTLENRLELGPPEHAGPQRAGHFPRKKKILLAYSALTTLVLVLGYFKSLREHIATIGASPELQLAAPGPHVLVVGEPYTLRVRVKNARRLVSTFASFEPPVVKGASPKGLLIREDPGDIFPDLAPGAAETLEYRLEPEKAGRYEVVARCVAEAGWFGGSRPFSLGIEVEVWKPLVRTRPRLAEWSARRAVLSFDLLVGRDQESAIQAEASVHEEGVSIAYVRTPGVSEWKRIPLVAPGKVEWAWPSMKAPREVPCEIGLKSVKDRSEAEWMNVMDQLDIEVLDAEERT